MKQRTRLVVAIALLLLSTSTVFTQDTMRLDLPFTINDEYQQQPGLYLLFEGAAGDSAGNFPSDKEIAFARTPDGILARLERIKGQKTPAFRLAIDSDADGIINESTIQTVRPGVTIKVRLLRESANGQSVSLPYSIKHWHDADRNGQLQDTFGWRPHYRAEGKLKVDGKETLLIVLDFNGDGVFDKRDSSSATTFGIDRNGDGQFNQQGEWLFEWQVIEYGGRRFLVESLAADGSKVTLRETVLRVPKVGERLPPLKLTTLEGKSISLDALRGKVHLLDFWASWCLPCVEKFPAVKRLDEEYKGRLSVIAVNVDEKSREPEARQVIKDYQLKWPHVLSGEGANDLAWRSFSVNSLSIPLYVLSDGEGRIQYIGSGGNNLIELHVAIKGLLSPKTSVAGATEHPVVIYQGHRSPDHRARPSRPV